MRFLSFLLSGMMLGFAFLLLVCAWFVGAAVSALGKWWGVRCSVWLEFLAQAVEFSCVGLAVSDGAFCPGSTSSDAPRQGCCGTTRPWIGAAVDCVAVFTRAVLDPGLYIGEKKKKKPPDPRSGFLALPGSLIICFSLGVLLGPRSS
jgi:hypothetical protein